MDNDVRQLIITAEFEEYYLSQSEKVREKFDYVMLILKKQRVVNSKFIKSIEKTNLYEMRVSVGTNEHRTFIFAIDTLNFIESKQVILLNSFLKKDTKQYKREIEKARSILKKMED